MSKSIPSTDDHEPVSSRSESSKVERSYTTVPSSGPDSRRPQVHAEGPEAISGFQTPPGAPLQGPRIRAISELTYKQPTPSPEFSDLHAAPPNRVVIPDTTQYPWRANAALLITVPGYAEKFQATGWFIGPYAVITVAHAVFPREEGGYVGWAAEVEVTPGLNGFPNPPPYSSSRSQTFQCPKGWQKNGSERLDYGVVLLSQPMDVGTQGFATAGSNVLSSAVAHLAGYPVASPDGTEPQGRQWYGEGDVTEVDDSFIFYSLGVGLGDSGGCVYRTEGNESYAMAIQSWSNGIVDRGIRINQSVYANMQQWKTMHA